ncbi:MAG: zinc ABC transporter substrate-binding protein [Rhodocyclales bacterium]|nr:zinc ABC transporter substrate-binding protein [Rhodocyclales bacterium]
MTALHVLQHLRRLTLILAALLPAAAHAEPLQVVASFSILGDFVQAVGGEHTRVVTLVGPGVDAHGYQPRPSDARAVRAADVVIANGLGFDAWIERLAKSAGRTDTVVIVSAGITPLVAADTHDHEGETEHHHGQAQFDPHAWQSVTNARQYVANIANVLAARDPGAAEHYAANAQRYIDALDALEHEIRTTLATLTPEQRTVVTSHDAFGYFAAAYGIRFVAASGISGEAETSATEVARLIRLLRSENARVAFVENIADPRLITRISEESGARIGGTLYSDTLSEAGGPASTYIELMRHNLRTLMAGLQPVPR